MEQKISKIAKELIEQDNSNLTPNQARVLAEANILPEIEEENKKIDQSISDEAEKEKRKMLEDLKDTHSKELSKLNDIMSNSEQTQRANFQKRLAQRKLMKEKAGINNNNNNNNNDSEENENPYKPYVENEE